MASRSVNDLSPLLAYAFGRAEVEFKHKYPNSPQPFLTATYRSNAEQTLLYNQPTDKKDNDGDGRIDEADERVTNARAGQSPHNYKPAAAFDVAFKNVNGRVFYEEGLFDLFAPLVLKTPGITWGGHFKSLKDKPHFELTGWQTLVKA